MNTFESYPAVTEFPSTLLAGWTPGIPMIRFAEYSSADGEIVAQVWGYGSFVISVKGFRATHGDNLGKADPMDIVRIVDALLRAYGETD